MKFWHVTVIDLQDHSKIAFQRKCLTVGEANTLLKAKKEEYSDKTRYMVMKENF
jgi:hypothetical protein